MLYHLLVIFSFYKTILSFSAGEFFNNTLCFSDIRHANYPNCYLGDWPIVDGEIPSDTIVAFIADADIKSSSIQVKQLILKNNANFVLHAGDLDYHDSPQAWEVQLDAVMGQDFRYFSSMGNHEYDAFEGTNGYQSYMFNRLLRQGANCTGTVGLAKICSYLGITFFVATPWQNYPTPFITQEELSQAIEDAFTQFGGKWRICVWHFNQHEYQLGNKGTEAQIFLYDTCRRMGALIHTGHEHSYARTHLMSSFEDFTVADTSSQLTISEGESVAWVSAVGGQSERPCTDNSNLNPWWGQALCTNIEPPLIPGALFCNFNPEGNGEDMAYCWFEQIDGQIRDNFNLTTTVQSSLLCQPEPGSTCRQNITYQEPAQCGFNLDIGCGLEVYCGCSIGEYCGQNDVCQCNQTECESLGRVCTNVGCVYGFNSNAVTTEPSGDVNERLLLIGIFSTIGGVLVFGGLSLLIIMLLQK